VVFHSVKGASSRGTAAILTGELDVHLRKEVAIPWQQLMLTCQGCVEMLP
jgi:hypothetical protein